MIRKRSVLACRRQRSQALPYGRSAVTRFTVWKMKEPDTKHKYKTTCLFFISCYI
jgi:hypothetical protein